MLREAMLHPEGIASRRVLYVVALAVDTRCSKRVQNWLGSENEGYRSSAELRTCACMVNG